MPPLLWDPVEEIHRDSHNLFLLRYLRDRSLTIAVLVAIPAKAGMIGLTKSTAKELASRGINCNAVAPGVIMSKMTDVLPDNVKENYLNNIPMKRFGTPEDVADVVSFLASDDSDYITGQVIHIDGGLVM